MDDLIGASCLTAIFAAVILLIFASPAMQETESARHPVPPVAFLSDYAERAAGAEAAAAE